MARITDLEIPPSLERLYREIVTPISQDGTTPNQARLNPWAQRRTPEPFRQGLARLAQEGAEWLTREWGPYRTERARSQFYENRRAEILAGDFLEPYWTPCTLLDDLTEWAAPEVDPYKGTPNPAYYDALRRPTNCYYLNLDRTYPTPNGPAGLPQPSPGWAGQVSDLYFEDAWMAQRRLFLQMPRAITYGDPPPMAVAGTVTINATATRKGNKAWFAVTAECYFYRSTEYAGHDKHWMVSYWPGANQTPKTIPDEDANGWSHTHTETLRRPALETWHWRPKPPYKLPEEAALYWADRCAVCIATPPGRGRYHANNDAVSVWHHSNVNLYLPRGENG